MKSILKKDTSLFLTIFILMFIIYFSSTVGIMNSVDAPQFSLTRAIVEERRTNIDSFSEYIWPDFAIFEGKKYLDREPGLSFLAIPFYVISRVFKGIILPPYGYPYATGITEESSVEALVYGLISCLVAIGVATFYLICRKMGFSKVASFLSSCLLALGSLMWKYSAGFVRQPILASFFIILFWQLLNFGKSRISTFSFLTLGLICGGIFIIDHLSVFTLFVFFLFFLYEFFKKERKRGKSAVKYFFLVLLGGLISLCPFLFYNYLSFDKFITSPRFYSALGGVKNPSHVLSAELKWTIPLNLFSYRPIPKEAFKYIEKYPKLSETFSSTNYWATRNKYRGIFIQSPILFLSLLGFPFLWRKGKKAAVWSFVVFLGYFLPASKIVVFYAPTAYDTRYVLPSVPFLFFGLPAFIDVVRSGRTRLLRWGGWLLILFLGAISIWNGFLSTATHFMPHVTGEHRITEGVIPYWSPVNFLENVGIMAPHVFPNAINLPIIVIPVLLMFIVFLLLKKKY